MNEEISDNKMRTMLQKCITDYSSRHNKEGRLKNIRLCGRSILKVAGNQSAILIRNPELQKTDFIGTASCHSSWACPKCTAIVMAKQGTNIACLIEALKKQQNKRAFMITFTIPHTKEMTCEESFQILHDTWRAFARGGNRSYNAYTDYTLKTDISEDKRAVGKKGTVKRYYKGLHPYGEFREALDIKHVVRIIEVTWGEESGWHPHIHALFWTHKKNFKKILNYQESLLDYWWKRAEEKTRKVLRKKYPDDPDYERADGIVLKLFSNAYKYPRTGHRAVYISTDKNNNVIEQQSSHYVAGWHADQELTGLSVKTARRNRYTPRQLLEQLAETGEIKWFRLYEEYAYTTFKHRRINFSPGCAPIIREWKKTEEFITAFKKNCVNLEAKQKWEIVGWFSSEEWKRICFIDSYSDVFLTEQILQLALQENARELINQLLEEYDIQLHTETTIESILLLEMRNSSAA